MKNRSMSTPWVLVIVLCIVIAGLLSFQADAQKKGGSFKDQFTEHIGKKTNLGKLQEVTGEYIVTSDEGVTFIYQISALQGLRMENNEESGGVVLEILLK
ncbi:MAG TPA: hypothetical protein VGB89_13255 [Bacteroidota bacterium]